MSRMSWWALLICASAAVLGLDLLTGPYILFPILFVIPVCLGAWYLGRIPSVGFAVVLIGCRLAIALTVESGLRPPWAAVLNAAIRLIVLIGLADLTARVALQTRELRERVQTLEGILPICAFCKKIRQSDGTWEQIEAYVSKRSAARFSHGFCESCGREHYPEMYRSESGKTAEPSAAADGGGGR